VSQMISAGERAFILDGVKEDIRCDGRSRVDFRAITVETGILANCNGSARVRVGGSDVLVGVKVEVAVPRASAPEEGFLQASIECAPGRDQKWDRDRGTAEALVLEKSLSCASSIDWRSLCHAKGESCWVIYVDVVAQHIDGLLLDAAYRCIRSPAQHSDPDRDSQL